MVPTGSVWQAGFQHRQAPRRHLGNGWIGRALSSAVHHPMDRSYLDGLVGGGGNSRRGLAGSSGTLACRPEGPSPGPSLCPSPSCPQVLSSLFLIHP